MYTYVYTQTGQKCEHYLDKMFFIPSLTEGTIGMILKMQFDKYKNKIQ